MNASEPIADIGKQALVELINRSFSAVDTVVAFTKEQVPEVLYQLLLWKAVQSFFIFSLCLLCIYGTFLFARHEAASSDNFSYFVAAIVSFMPLAVLFHMGIDWLYIWIAPKVYLIEYAAALVK